MNIYRVTIKNFHYPDLIWEINGGDEEQVRKLVCELEGCPPSSIKEIKLIRKIG